MISSTYRDGSAEADIAGISQAIRKDKYRERGGGYGDDYGRSEHRILHQEDDEQGGRSQPALKKVLVRPSRELAVP